MGLNPGDASGDVTIAFGDAVARLLAPEMRGVPRMHLRRGNAADQLPPLSTSKWSLQKTAGGLRRWHPAAHRDPGSRVLGHSWSQVSVPYSVLIAETGKSVGSRSRDG